MATPQDRWLHPRQQTEYPARDLISEVTLHARREATFLALGATFLVATTAMILLGTSRIVDVSALLRSVAPDLDLSIALALPIGMLPSALAFVAIMLVCELYGRRRASALIWAGVFAAGAIVGLAQLLDVIDARDASFGAALAFAAYFLCGQVASLLVFDALRARSRGRRFWVRAVFASVFAQVLGCAALGGAMYGYDSLSGAPDVTHITALALGSAAYVVASTVLILLPVALVAHALALFLRVARFVPDDEERYHAGPRREREPAMIVEEEPRRRPARAQRAALEPFSHAELRFFTEGDQIGLEAAARD